MRARRNILGLLRVYYYSCMRMGYSIDHFNLSPDFYGSYQRTNKDTEKFLPLPGGIRIPVRSYGWIVNDNSYFRIANSHCGKQMILMDIETILK